MILQDLDPSPSNWCKFEAVDDKSFKIIVVVIIGQFLLLCLFLRSLSIRVRHNIFISSDQAFLFKVISVWFAIGFLKSLINIIAYTVYMSNDNNQNQQSEIILSGMCMFFDKMGSFSLHTVLIKIPCMWIKNSIMKLENQQLTFPEMKRIDFIFRVLNKINLYFKIRLLIVIANIAFLTLFFLDPNYGRFSPYITIASMVQATMAIFIYTFGVVNLQRFRNLLDFPKRIQFRVKVQYGLLMVCSIMRLVFNFLYYFLFSINIYEPRGNCLDNNEESSAINYFYLSLGYAIMHILPIITIIVIYWPDVDPDQHRQSLISLVNGQDKKVRIQTSSCLLGSGNLMYSGKNHVTIQYSDRKQFIRKASRDQ